MRRWLSGLLLALIALIGGVLVWTTGVDRAPVGATPALSETQEVDGLRVTLQVDQALPGTRVVDIAVRDTNDAPVDLQAVRLRFAMHDPASGFVCNLMSQPGAGTSEVVAQTLGAGHYQARGPFFTMVGSWQVEATLERSGTPSMVAPFAVAIAAPGEAAGPLNPIVADNASIAAGAALYQTNCASCHGETGHGDGPAAAGLSPRPANFTQHMGSGLHTDGQVYLWIHDGFPGSAMPAWNQRLRDDEIWQLVAYLRTFGVASATTPVATPVPTAQLAATDADAVAAEPLPPSAFARAGNIWRSDGSAAEPTQLTKLPRATYAKNPAFSPDGQQIAFITIAPPQANTALAEPTSELLVMQADGSGLHHVWKPDAGLLEMPSWAPDGKTLYVGISGTQPAPDGKGLTRLVQVLRIDLATGAREALLPDALNPTLSRDGRTLAYLQLSPDASSTALKVAAADGSGARVVLDGTQFRELYAPRFAPDGQSIVFAAVGGPETDDQGNPKAATASPLQWLASMFAPAIAEAHGPPWDLWVVKTDGSGLRRLTTMYEDLPMASFSPDGSEIAFMGAGGIYRMRADGSDLRKLDWVGDHGGMMWAPR